MTFAERYTDSTTMQTEFVWNDNQPLVRCKGESKRAHDAFTDYARMGSGRSLRLQLAEYKRRAADGSMTRVPPTTSWGTLSSWSMRFAWPARATRGDELQHEEDRRKLQEERLEKERLWQARREQVREEDWEMAHKLREVAGDVLAAAPNHLKTTRKLVRGRNGQPDQIIVTIALDANLAVKAADTASKLSRLAADMSTEHVEQDVVVTEDLESVRRRRWAETQSALSQSLDEDSNDGENDA